MNKEKKCDVELTLNLVIFLMFFLTFLSVIISSFFNYFGIMYYSYSNYHNFDDKIIKNELSQYCDNVIDFKIYRNNYKSISHWNSEFKTPISINCNNKLIRGFIYSHYHKKCETDFFGDETCKMVLDIEIQEVEE